MKLDNEDAILFGAAVIIVTILSLIGATFNLSVDFWAEVIRGLGL